MQLGRQGPRHPRAQSHRLQSPVHGTGARRCLLSRRVIHAQDIRTCTPTRRSIGRRRPAEIQSHQGDRLKSAAVGAAWLAWPAPMPTPMPTPMHTPMPTPLGGGTSGFSGGGSSGINAVGPRGLRRWVLGDWVVAVLDGSRNLNLRLSHNLRFSLRLSHDLRLSLVNTFNLGRGLVHLPSVGLVISGRGGAREHAIIP